MRAVKPLIVLGGPIHPDGMTQLEAEATVIVTDATSEAGMIAAAKDAEGILFRSKPDCTRSLMAACPKLKVVGRHGVRPHIVDLPPAPDPGVARGEPPRLKPKSADADPVRSLLPVV